MQEMKRILDFFYFLLEKGLHICILTKKILLYIFILAFTHYNYEYFLRLPYRDCFVDDRDVAGDRPSYICGGWTITVPDDQYLYRGGGGQK